MPSGATFVARDATYEEVGRDVAAIAFRHPGGQRWWVAFVIALALVGLLVVIVAALLWSGPGLWGNNIPVTWALDIVSYDFWMGIACGALGIAALLVLLRIEWGAGVSRLLQAVAMFSTGAGAVYPIIHLGRQWFFYWTLPYPNSMLLWPQWRSPLVWDAIDIIGFLVVCLGFFSLDMLPDLAALRDRAAEQVRAGAGRSLFRAQVYGILALGWRGSARQWQRWTAAHRTLALLAVVVVVALQTGAAVMFAGTVEPGWHDTLLPVAMIFESLWLGAGVATAVIAIVRAGFGLQAMVTRRHLDLLGRTLLGLGLVNLYIYFAQFFVTALGGDSFEFQMLHRRAFGDHAWALWFILVFALLPVQLLWIGRLRRSGTVLAVVGLLITIGMWADHFMVIVTTQQLDFLPTSDRRPYGMDAWGVLTFVGSIGLFLFLLLLFLRYLPVVSILQTRRLAHVADVPARGPAPVRTQDAPLWGVAAEFGSAAAMAAALAVLHDRGFSRLEAYSPVEVPEAAAAMRLRHPPIGWLTAASVAFGLVLMFGLCTYATTYDYVFDIAGRPRFSWPYFVIESVSFAMLTGTLGVWIGMIVLNRLPRLNHPAFNIPGFVAATQDRFFAVVEARDEGFDPDAVERVMAALDARPIAIARVPR